MEYINKWNDAIIWCENHDFPWIIINNHFYFQTNYQTGEITPKNKFIWHPFDHLTKLLTES